MSKVIEGVEDIVDKTAEESIEMIIMEIMVIAKAGIGLERDHFQEIMTVTELKVQAIVDQGQDPESVPIGTG